MEALARREVDHGLALMELWGKLFRGEPIPQKLVKLLPAAKRRRGKMYEVFEVPYFPTVDDRKWASERLAERGWGKAPQVVNIDEGEPGGFAMVFRRWPPGVDPVTNTDWKTDAKARRALPRAFSSDERDVDGADHHPTRDT